MKKKNKKKKEKKEPLKKVKTPYGGWCKELADGRLHVAK